LSFALDRPWKKFLSGATGFSLTGNKVCLHSKIWTSQIKKGARPVLIFIHGGNNQHRFAAEKKVFRALVI